MFSLSPFFVTILFAVSGITKADQPGFCKLEFGECIDNIIKYIADESVSETGNPSLNIEPSDPMFFNNVEGNLQIVNYKLINSTIKGYRFCQFKNIKTKLNESRLHLELECPKDITIKGIYEVDGHLPNWEVKRQGTYDFHLGAFNVSIDAVMGMIQRQDGKIFLKIKDFVSKIKVMTPIDAKFNNQIGENAANLYDRDTWQGFADLIQEPLLMSSFKKMLRAMNVHLRTIWFEDSEYFH